MTMPALAWVAARCVQARETFNHTLEELMSKPLMTPRPLGTLLDLRKMQAHWRRNYGIALQEASGQAGRGGRAGGTGGGRGGAAH